MNSSNSSKKKIGIWGRIKQLNIGTYIVVAALAVILVFVFIVSPVNQWVAGQIPPAEITVSVLDEINPEAAPNYEAWITHINFLGNEDIKDIFEKCDESSGFEYRSAVDYGYSADLITNISKAGSYLKWSTAEQSGTISLEFWKQGFSGIVDFSVTRAGEEIFQTKIDLYTAEPNIYDTFTYELTPYELPMDIRLKQWGIMIGSGIVIFAIFIIGLAMLLPSEENEKKHTTDNSAEKTKDLDGN